jgi:diguanylate cyclase (GGDEF)-like protein
VIAALVRLGVVVVLAVVTATAVAQGRRMLLAQQAEEVHRLAALAEGDGLTGLYNRRAFDRQVALEFRRARRYGRPLSVILLDLDRLKDINDTYGHAAGDLALRTLGSVLADVTRTTDLVARVGGDEFGVVLPETDVAAAELVVERLHAVLRTWPVLVAAPSMQHTVRLHVSAGVVALAPDMQTEAALLEAADRLLYADKQRGRPGRDT